MKKWIVLSLAVLVPALAFASTASKLGVYTTDNVPGFTHGYTDQFGNFTAPADSWKGATTGTVTVQPEATATGTVFLANPALSSTATSLSLTSTVTPLAIPGFAATLSNSALYQVHAHIHGSNAGSGGLKLTTSGSATPSVYNLTVLSLAGTAIGALSNTTTVGTAALASTTTFTDAYLDGTVSTGTTGAGTFQVWAGQNVSDATALTISTTGSQMQIWRVQ